MNTQTEDAHSILVVDDEAVIITQMEEMLSSLGYNVVGKAGSGAQAIKLAHELSPDLVLMDIVMPGDVDGIAACSVIQREMDIPVILLTAYGDDKHISRAKAVQPYGYILKPSQNDQIKAAVEIVLEKKAVERNLDGMMDGLRHTAEDRRLQIKEIHHRIKNNLNMITALLALQAMHSATPECSDALQAVRSRVVTIAKIHEKLHTSDNMEHIDCGEYFESIACSLLRASDKADAIDFSFQCEPHQLEPDKVMPMGLILNELASNAMHHAFGQGEQGRITISFRREGPDYVLSVTDNGVGLPEGVTMETAESLGLELVRSLVAQVGGTLHLRQEAGTAIEVHFPV
ncbi:histidine kinase dimerization/phosphoacceptor domain -containing protein [Desulfobaculum senezii]|jgi:two-component sensor histidine kinase